jgi:hypothetical protein
MSDPVDEGRYAAAGSLCVIMLTSKSSLKRYYNRLPNNFRD